MVAKITDFPDFAVPKKNTKLLSLFLISLLFAFAIGTNSSSKFLFCVSVFKSLLKDKGSRLSLSNERGFSSSLSSLSERDFNSLSSLNDSGLNWSFNIDKSAIKVFPDSKIYAIGKDSANERNVISYSIYSYATEQYTRKDSFLGSSILFIDQISEEGTTLNSLQSFHRNLRMQNLDEGAFIVSNSDSFNVSKPKGLSRINDYLRKVNNVDFKKLSDRELVVYCETNWAKLQCYFSDAILLLNIYDTIYFTESQEVAQYVHQKGIFKIIDINGFERELLNITNNLHN